MMIHRKNKHKEIVKCCSQFRLGTCRFKDDSCWFQQELEGVKETKENDKKVVENAKENPEQVFQKVLKPKEPPLQNQGEEKKIQEV